MEYTALTFPIHASSFLMEFNFSDVMSKEIEERRASEPRREFVHMYRIRDGKINLNTLASCKRMIAFNVDKNVRVQPNEPMQYDHIWVKTWLSQCNGTVYPICGYIDQDPNKEKKEHVGFVFAEPADAVLFKMSCGIDNLTTTVLTDENFE